MRKKEIPEIISKNTRARAVPLSHPLLGNVRLSAGYTDTDNKYMMQLFSFLVGDMQYFLRPWFCIDLTKSATGSCAHSFSGCAGPGVDWGTKPPPSAHAENRMDSFIKARNEAKQRCFSSTLLPGGLAEAPSVAERSCGRREETRRDAGSTAGRSLGLGLSAVSHSVCLPAKISLQFQKFKK